MLRGMLPQQWWRQNQKQQKHRKPKWRQEKWRLWTARMMAAMGPKATRGQKVASSLPRGGPRLQRHVSACLPARLTASQHSLSALLPLLSCRVILQPPPDQC